MAQKDRSEDSKQIGVSSEEFYARLGAFPVPPMSQAELDEWQREIRANDPEEELIDPWERSTER